MAAASSATPARRLSDAEKAVIVESLELKEKSHERAARASTGAVSGAHTAAAMAVRTLILVFKNQELEI